MPHLSDDDHSSTSEVEANSSVHASILDDMDGESEMTCQTVLEAASQLDNLVVETPVAPGEVETPGLGSSSTGVSTESREDTEMEDLGHKLTLGDKDPIPVKNLLSVDIPLLSSSKGPWAYKVQEHLKSKKPEGPDKAVLSENSEIQLSEMMQQFKPTAHASESLSVNGI